MIPFVVPVLNRFDLFTQMMHSVDYPIIPHVVDSWNNNRGVSAAWNDGLFWAKERGYRYTIITNDDVIFSPGSIARLHKVIIETGACIVSPKQIPTQPQAGLINGADFYCYIVDVDQLLERCGTFDENFIRAYFEDNDMVRRMFLAGVTGYIDTDNYVYHHGSATQYADPTNPVVPPPDFERNRAYFVEKWGGVPGQETYLTPFNNPDYTVKNWIKR